MDLWGYTAAEVTSNITFEKELEGYPTMVSSYPYYASGDNASYWPLARKMTKTGGILTHARWGSNGLMYQDTNVAQQWYARGTIRDAEKPHNAVIIIKAF